MLFTKADGILDLSSRTAFLENHLKGSTWLAMEQLPESLNALPASPASLYLVGDQDQIEAASILLDAKGYSVSGSLVIDSDDAMQRWAQQLPDMVESGKVSRQLWQPSALVKDLLDKLQKEELSLPAANARPEVLDIGCGGGRDAIFMARQKMNVLAIDNENKVLKRAKQLAELSGAQVKFKCCDIKKDGCLPEQSFDIIMQVRFLNRDKFDYIKSHLKPGGLILMQTFVEGVEKFASPKNPNFILKQGELQKEFSGFEIIVDKIDVLPDGRPVNSFIARKPI